jgi:glycosyltransferase involved in cell wall biosynthesis
MIKVTALTSGRNVPSSRFRIRQFIQPLSHLGIGVTEYALGLKKYTPGSFAPLRYASDATKILARLPGLVASRSSDITWLERELVPRRHTLERFAGTKRLFDVDDAIWLTSDSPFSEAIARASDGVIAGNRFLAEHYQKAGARVWVVPTSIDTDIWRPRTRKEDDPWVIGWIGTSSNLQYLYDLEQPLADFLSQHPTSTLRIVCDKRPSFKRIPASTWQFAYWSAETEVREVQEMDVGLMPLPNTEWARGKCAFKMIAYMAIGAPVIVSPVGVNQEILQQAEVGLPASTNGDWYEALELLFRDRERAATLGRAGTKLVEDSYSVNRNAELLAKIFEEVAGR